MAGKEFRSKIGKPMKIQRALYGLKSEGKSWHRALSTTLKNMGFESSRSDPDIWPRLSTNTRREKHREWIVVYLEDLLAISKDLKAIIET